MAKNKTPDDPAKDWYKDLPQEEVQKQINECPKKRAIFLEWYGKTDAFKKSFAKQYLSPSVQAANTILTYKHESEALDYGSLETELENQCKALRGNNLELVEDILLSHIVTLDNLFHKQARRAKAQDCGDRAKIYLDSAFKAQRQCRTTAETLALMKNPQPFVGRVNVQQNSANQMQVNNGVNPDNVTSTHARTKENKKSRNELLEDRTHEWLDTGTQSPAIGADKVLETVGAIDRPENT